MNFALWLQLVAILCTCWVSLYLMYAAWVVYQQSTAASVPVPSGVFYLFATGTLVLAFSVWRLSRAIATFKAFRAQYRAHAEATRQT
jgi:hypothetical protein